MSFPLPKRVYFFIFALVLQSAVACAAADNPEKDYTHAGLFANAKEVFKPLLADPRELQLAVRLTTPITHKALGDVAVGDYFGLYRWTLPWENSFLQWSIGGGIFSRFDLVTEQKDNEVIDYSARMPLDFRIGSYSLRLMPFHLSSHLGDDYIKRTGILPQKYALDGVKWLLAYEPGRHLRFYAGSHSVLRHTDAAEDHYVWQGGAEWNSTWWANGHAQTFLASDIQSWEPTAWNPETTTQLGIRIAHDPDDKHALALFGEYGAGHLLYGQLVNTQESHFSVGLRFELP